MEGVLTRVPSFEEHILSITGVTKVARIEPELLPKDMSLGIVQIELGRYRGLY